MGSSSNYSEHIFLFPFTWQVFTGRFSNKSFDKLTDIEYTKKLFSDDWEMQINSN